MKTKLHFFKAAGIALVLSSQVNFAQTGGAYNGPHNAGNISNPAGFEIYFRDFDLGTNQNATINPTGVAPFGYSDSSAGNVAGNGTTYLNNDYRPGTDVDMAAPASGLSAGVVSLNSGGNEFNYYTVEFADDGKYHIDVNYGHSNANPRGIRFELLDVAFTNSPVVLANGSLVKTNSTSGSPGTLSGGSSTKYSNDSGEIIGQVNDKPTNAASDTPGNTIQFDVAAGTYVIKVTTINNGPNYVYFKFVRDGNATTLSADTFEGTTNSLVVNPNPSKGGVFNLNIDTKWEVYSILGAKIAEGEGTNIDLSNAAKGTYILKAANTTRKLISE